MKFEDSQTRINLARTFAGECQDGARYQFIAKKAMAEGYSFISDTLKTLAKNEMAHASRVYELIVKLSDGNCKNIDINAGFPFDSYIIPESFERSAEIEHMEAKNIYTNFAKIAKDEGFLEASELLMLIADVEKCHHMLLTELTNRYNNKCIYKQPKPIKWKCSNCGHEETAKEAWKDCPLCSYSQGYVMIDFSDN